MKKNPVNWFEIYVDDIERSKKFYSTVLAYDIKDMPMSEGSKESDGYVDSKMAAFPWVDDAPNASGALVQMKGVKAGGNSTLVYFDCEDCSIEQGRVEAAGGKVFKPKFSIGEYGFCAVCIDTEGNHFGLYSMK